jgi:hypothetical protein
MLRNLPPLSFFDPQASSLIYKNLQWVQRVVTIGIFCQLSDKRIDLESTQLVGMMNISPQLC